MLRFVFFAMFVTLLSFNAGAQVWVDTNKWSPEWDQRYQQWVRQNWQVDVFSRRTLPDGRTNPYYGMRVDCADTVYSMRIIFSYENSLPFAVLDPTGSGKLITNRMTRFNSISNRDERFRQFLWEMYATIATATVPNDTFPVALTPVYVHAGAMMLVTKVNHHSWSVKDILSIGVPWLVFNSTIGANSSLVLQERQSWPNPYWVFEGDASPAGNAGFRYWRPLEWIGKPVWQVPGYSEEQYRVPLDKWQKLAQTRLAVRKETDEQMMNRLTQTACADLGQRVGAVKDGTDYLAKNPSCMNYETYDNYSTPNRDQRFFDDIVALRLAYKDIVSVNGGANLSDAQKRQLNKIFPAITKSAKQEAAMMGPQSVTADSVCTTAYRPGVNADLAEVKRRLFAGLLSNNPLDEIEYRWGEKAGHSQRARSCQSWDPWSPDLDKLD